MFKKIIILVFLICFSSQALSISKSATYSKSLKKSLVLISNKCYDYMKYTNFDNSLHEAISSVKNKNFKIRKFYLNCHNECSQEELIGRFKIIWKKVLEIDPDYLVISDNILWNNFTNEIQEFSERPNKLTGVFNLISNENIFNDFQNLAPNILFSTHVINITPVVNYFAKNGGDFSDYYILRDACPYNLDIAVSIRKQLKRMNQQTKVNVIEVYSGRHLKNIVTELQIEKQGVIIPIMDSLMGNNGKHININNILSIIKSHNRKHVEVSLTYDASKFLGISYAHNANISTRRIKLENNLIFFLEDFVGDEKKYLNEKSLLIVNRQEVGRVFNGTKLLRVTNHIVDIFR